MRTDFIFELYTEEVPPSYQEIAILFIERELPALLRKNQIDFSSCQISGSARRLYLYFKELATEQKKWREELKGPPKQACFDRQERPTKQLWGFASKAGVDQEQIKFKTIGNSEYAVVYRSQGGEKSIALLGRLLPSLFLKIPFPKTMKWYAQDIRLCPANHKLFLSFWEGAYILQGIL